jgi:hypothetical protein
VKIRNYINKLGSNIRDNIVELWGLLSLFVGLPVVLGLYFDYRASLAFLFSSSVVLAVLAIRRGE